MSPAKINLHLDLRERREDGFHELISIFQMIDFEDHIRIRSLKKQSFCGIEGNFPIAPEENIMYRAYKLFSERTGCTKGISIITKKEIPWGAGLGGGSSNAAAVLLACDTLFKTALGRGELIKLAAILGSDVPFFLNGPAALVTGRGEKIEPLKPRKDFWLVVVVPEFAISTADAYRWFDQWRNEKWRTEKRKLRGIGKSSEDSIGFEEKKERKEKEAKKEKERIRETYLFGDFEDWEFFNSFAPVLYRDFPQLEELVHEMKTQGAVYSAVSGSGSAVFGIFLNKKVAKNTADSLKTYYTRVRVVAPKRIRFEVKAL